MFYQMYGKISNAVLLKKKKKKKCNLEFNYVVLIALSMLIKCQTYCMSIILEGKNPTYRPNIGHMSDM